MASNLHPCNKGHQLITYDGWDCPWCADKEQAKEDIARLQDEVYRLEDKVDELKGELVEANRDKD